VEKKNVEGGAPGEPKALSLGGGTRYSGHLGKGSALKGRGRKDLFADGFSLHQEGEEGDCSSREGKDRMSSIVEGRKT